MTTPPNPDPLSHRALGLPIHYVDSDGRIRTHRAISLESRRQLHNALHPDNPIPAPPPPTPTRDRFGDLILSNRRGRPLPVWVIFLPALLIVAVGLVFAVVR